MAFPALNGACRYFLVFFTISRHLPPQFRFSLRAQRIAGWGEFWSESGLILVHFRVDTGAPICIKLGLIPIWGQNYCVTSIHCVQQSGQRTATAGRKFLCLLQMLAPAAEIPRCLPTKQRPRRPCPKRIRRHRPLSRGTRCTPTKFLCALYTMHTKVPTLTSVDCHLKFWVSDHRGK